MNIIVTGATKGIGRAIVEKFANKGYSIYFCARTPQDVAALVDELVVNYPQQTFKGYAVDMANKSAVLQFAKDILHAITSIEVLVNNAGVYLPGNVIDEADGTLEQQIATNLYSAYYLTQKLVPTMIEAGKGHIFNMCSIASLQAYPGGGSYSISKYALLGFSDNLRLELKDKGVKVTAVMPGATYSNSWAGSGIDEARIMEANDIAEMVYHSAQLSPQAVVERIVIRPQLGDL